MSRSTVPALGRRKAFGTRSRPKTPLQRTLAGQHSLLHADQAQACGLSKYQLSRLHTSGRWDRPQPNVYGPADVPYTPERILLAGCMSASDPAMSFGRAASWVWGLTRERVPASYEIVVSRRQRPRLTGIVVHRFADVDLTEPVMRRGVPVTNPLRTVADLGAVAAFDEVMAAVETGHRMGLLRMPALTAELARVARRGRDGCGVLRAVLDELNVLGSWTPSRLESKAREVFQRAGLPDPQSEVVWGPDGEYRLDFFWPALRLVVEVDGWSFHSSSTAHAHDLRRQNKLVLAGLPPLRYSWADIVRDGGRVVAELRSFKAF